MGRLKVKKNHKKALKCKRTIMFLIKSERNDFEVTGVEKTLHSDHQKKKKNELWTHTAANFK